MLWLSAALAAIAFSLATTVRGETERVSTALDGLRAYHLACGGIYRAGLEFLWSSSQTPDKRLIPKGASSITYQFASGEVHVDIVPEAAKLDVNHVTVDVLNRLLAAMGVEPGRAQEIAAGIDEYRRPAAGGAMPDQSPFSLSPTFQPRHASFQEIEELLLVQGVTPDIFYGTYLSAAEEGTPSGRLVRRSGLVDCLSVYGSVGQVDATGADPALLAALGMDSPAIDALVQSRQAGPLSQDQLGGANSLTLGGHSMYTLRATARLRFENGQLGDLRRSVAAQFKFVPNGFHIVRWFDTVWSN